MELFLISRPDFFADEISLLNKMMEEEEFIFHLRKPQSSEESILQYLSGLNPLFHTRTVIHHHYHLKELFQLKGLHFTEKARKDLTTGSLEKLIFDNYPLTVSSSFHDLDDMVQQAQFFNYIFISPVFPTISKPSFNELVDLKNAKKSIGEIRKVSTCKVVALGGILQGHIPVLREAGFEGVGVIGSIWQDKNPLQQLSAFIKILN